jgi:hypothetical protein
MSVIETMMIDGPDSGLKKSSVTNGREATKEEEGTKFEQADCNHQARTTWKSKPRKRFCPEMGPDKEWLDEHLS